MPSCLFPRADAQCGVSECKKTNEVWALNDQFAAIRDIKMCGCPSSFIHGLVMPRDIVTGVEDPNRQEGIWQYAWDVAIQRIEPESLALVVNPRSERTQNQLHVHMLRINKATQSNFAQYDPIYIDSLEKVWATTEKAAQNKGLVDYGVLVAKGPLSEYMVLVMPHSPEAAFTVWSCE
jgi:CDP-diacylglycerol pyrophosphatase